MVLAVVRPGLLATIQGCARQGLRHQGIPASGPADSLSMALANRLCGNAPDASAIEITFGGAEFAFNQDTAFSFAGACATATLSARPVPSHETLQAMAGDRLAFAHPLAGVRTYLAIPGGFAADLAFASTSTFVPAAFGGHAGRALLGTDTLSPASVAPAPERLVTPPALRPAMKRAHALRAAPGPDAAFLPDTIWAQPSQATNRMDRTGIELAGSWPVPEGGAHRPSAALFPGAVQLTPSGNMFVLLPDAQTTGGYPHVLQVIRADRHILGQIAPGDRITFLRRSADEAYQDLKRKSKYLSDWLPGFAF
ncbi:allophanate hydrolase subunit 2 family protein [Hyphomonas sp.]|uniref:5-oxoprolinase subunit C family protein n=1 Tax=Hyphomonas sp. TaxID=87 RepID=UPI001BCD1D06|nr:allophanate hydrolase subunit 2 family protein [Hyphomonas sp.]